jgi:hypothetical protein
MVRSSSPRAAGEGTAEGGGGGVPRIGTVRFVWRKSCNPPPLRENCPIWLTKKCARVFPSWPPTEAAIHPARVAKRAVNAAARDTGYRMKHYACARV